MSVSIVSPTTVVSAVSRPKYFRAERIITGLGLPVTKALRPEASSIMAVVAAMPRLFDGSAMVCHSDPVPEVDQASFPVTEELHRCADLLSDAGFIVALVKGERGVYLNAQ